jgi:hypothetical protein
MSMSATYASDTTLTVALADALPAGAAAAALSGVPSTTLTLLRGESVLEGVRAAGSILLPGERRTLPLLAAAAPVHLALSFGWAAVLAVAVPPGREIEGAVAGGLVIAALDLGVVARLWFPRIRALPQGRQWADHVAYGLAVGAVLRARRRARLTPAAAR